MKTAVIGMGRMGRQHAQVVHMLGLNLAGVCDLNPHSLSIAETELNIPKDRQFLDAETMLAKINPECVIVATTAPTHCHYTCMAAEAGARYILCEKPMAISLAECDKMMEACSSRNVLMSINHQMRFMEQYLAPKRIAKSEAFGELRSITVVAGNFGMAMNGTHYFEMFRFMTGEAPVEVTAWFSEGMAPNPRGPQFQDRAGAVRLVTASGKRFYMDIGIDQGHGMKVVYAGTYGQIIVDELAGEMFYAVRQAQHRALPTTRYGMPWDSGSEKIAPAEVTAPTLAVLRALLQGKDYPTPAQARLAVSALVAAYVSDENGHMPVKLSGDLPIERVFPWP